MLLQLQNLIKNGVDMTVYIVNYKPDDADKREKRNKIHYEQLDWFLDNCDNEIWIVAMNYKIGEYRDHPRIHYIKHPERALANEVRWRYFKPMFDQQTEPWAIFSDDDCWLYSDSYEKHCDGPTFIRDIHKDPHKWDETPIIWPFHPNASPYKHKVEQKLYKENFVLERSPKNGCMFFFLRKLNGIQFPSGLPDDYEGDETIFTLNNFIHGFPSYVCNNIGLKEACAFDRLWIDMVDKDDRDTSGLFKFEEETSLTSTVLNAHNNLNRIFADYGLHIGNKLKGFGGITPYIERFPKKVLIPK
jgi:hypothetical protein